MRSQEGGFTLIEIMVVLVIIAGLAYVVSTNVIGRLGKARLRLQRFRSKTLRVDYNSSNLIMVFYPELSRGLKLWSPLQPPDGFPRTTRKRDTLINPKS